MAESAVSPLHEWQNFYVIVGSSAGALTGLQFVVIALIAEAQVAGMLEIRAFGTPTIVHFGAALLVSAVMSAPWHALSSAGTALGFCGAAGVLYAITVIRHAPQADRLCSRCRGLVLVRRGPAHRIRRTGDGGSLARLLRPVVSVCDRRHHAGAALHRDSQPVG